MLDKDKPVQGYVIYAEFQHAVYGTRQIFFTPDGFTSTGRLVPMQAHYRTISKDTPRKQWKTTYAGNADLATAISRSESGEGDFHALTATLSEEWAETRVLSVLRAYLNQTIINNWTMVGSPLVVEASKQDMDDIVQRKTPTKIIYRINQSRVAAGYPEELF